MKDRITRLKTIANELHDLANSFAGDATGTAAANLHGAAGRVLDSVRMLETGITDEDEKKSSVNISRIKSLIKTRLHWRLKDWLNTFLS